MTNNIVTDGNNKLKDPVIFQISEWREFDEISEDSDNDIENTNYNDFMNENKNDKNASKKIKTRLNPKYYSEYRENNENRKYTIRMFGRTSDDKSVHVKVLNYSPHFYIELPEKWTDKNTDNLIACLKDNSELKHVKNNLIAYDIVSRHKFREFNNYKKFNFLRLIFNNGKAMKDFSYLFVKSRMFIPGIIKPIKFNVYESNIDSILRCMHIRNVPSCGWVEIKKYNKCKDNVNCDINIECDWKLLKPSENQNKFAKFKIAIFDIECNSGDGSFPQANRIEDKIIQIGTVFGKHNGDIYRRHIITLGSCDPIEGTEVISVNTERELLIEWVKIMKEESPDFLSGYNIWQFDERYMYERALHPRINCQNLFSKLSKLVDYNCILDKSELSSSALGDNIMKYIDTVGITQLDLMKIIQADHKLDKYSLDFVSEYFIQEKISKYTILDDYHLEIESKNLHFVKTGNYVKIINQAELEYGIKEENLYEDDDDYEDYCDVKYKILSIYENKMIIESKDVKFNENGLKELGKGLKWGLVKDDIKPNDIFRLQRGSSKDRKMIAEYCIQDCVLVYKIMAKLDIITHKICMANVCYVPFYYLLIRGQGIKGLSLVSKKCREKEFLIPNLSKLENDVSYEGAIVFDPKTGFYQTYIPVLDYNSLYPSSMISHNISHEMIVIDPQYDNLPEYIYKDVTYENKDGTSSTCRYAKSKIQDKFGIIPEILMELLSERKKAKKMMESTNDLSEKSNYNGKQNSLKITANSIYGILGAGTSPLCMKELAASTTAVGRSMLETARNFVENDYVPILMKFYQALIDEDDETFDELIEMYLIDKRKENIDLIISSVLKIFNSFDVRPNVIYGDTDSIFINMTITDKNTGSLLISKDGLINGINLGELASLLIKKRLPYPHNLEYEKTFYPFWIGRKKGYVGNKYTTDVNYFVQSSMGIVMKRRDNANIVKKIMGGLINIVLNENDIDKALQYVRTTIENLLNGKYPITDFTTTKSLKARYKGTKKTNTNEGVIGSDGSWFWDDVDCGQAHVKLCQRMKQRDPGTAPAVNDRIPSVAVVVPRKKGVKLLQGDIIEHPDYIREKNLKIDYLFYLTNQIMNPAVQFLTHIISKPQELFDEYIKKQELIRNGNVPLVIIKDNKESLEFNSLCISYDPMELYDKTIGLNKKSINAHQGDVVKKRQIRKSTKVNTEITKKLYLDEINDF
jgi:DNA polymerase elongation subunit (family B)